MFTQDRNKKCVVGIKVLDRYFSRGISPSPHYVSPLTRRQVEWAFEWDWKWA